jgi:hypothetical protein
LGHRKDGALRSGHRIRYWKTRFWLLNSLGMSVVLNICIATIEIYAMVLQKFWEKEHLVNVR